MHGSTSPAKKGSPSWAHPDPQKGRRGEGRERRGGCVSTKRSGYARYVSVTGVQTCALPILGADRNGATVDAWLNLAGEERLTVVLPPAVLSDKADRAACLRAGWIESGRRH